MTLPVDKEECDCAAAKEQLDAFRRGELTPTEVTALCRHLEHCRHCQCLQQYEAAFLERLRTIGATGCCPERLRARLGELLSHASRNG